MISRDLVTRFARMMKKQRSGSAVSSYVSLLCEYAGCYVVAFGSIRTKCTEGIDDHQSRPYFPNHLPKSFSGKLCSVDAPDQEVICRLGPKITGKLHS